MMIYRLLRVIQSYSTSFTPKDETQLKLLSEQQKNAVAFDTLWQEYFQGQEITQLHQITCRLIEMGLALDEWYNGMDTNIYPDAYLCLKYLPITAKHFNEENQQEKLSQQDYVLFYEELIKFTRACLHFHIFNENLEKNYDPKQYGNQLLGM